MNLKRVKNTVMYNSLSLEMQYSNHSFHKYLVSSLHELARALLTLRWGGNDRIYLTILRIATTMLRTDHRGQRLEVSQLVRRMLQQPKGDEVG